MIKRSNYKNKKILTNGGQAMMIAVMFFLSGSLIVLGGVVSPVLKDVKITRSVMESKQSIYISESGVEDLVYRVKNDMNFSNTENITTGDVSATTTITTVGSNREVVSVGDKDSVIRIMKAVISAGAGASFNYALQAGDGGVEMESYSYVSGNVFSNTEIEGESSNVVDGDVVSAGPDGLIDDLSVTGSGYANTISDSTIDVDAYYQSISDTDVGGMSYPGSPDQTTGTMPISDSLITDIETDAANGGTISSPCPYIIDSDVTLGPIKINCDLEINDTSVVTLEGNIWVVGDIIMRNSAIIQIAPSLGGDSVVVVADDPLDREDSSTISIKNSVTFVGSGSEGSYVVMISQNNDAENGGGEEAIEVKNSVSGDLVVYAPHGKIQIKNSAYSNGAAGYEVELNNSGHIDYNPELTNLLFAGDLDGGFNLDSWLEI